MEENRILSAKDCLEFNLNNEEEEALKYFIKNNNFDNNIFNFDKRKEKNEDIILAEYDYRQGKWRAGRFIGRSKFVYNDKEYELVIEPRFGNLILFKMVEEIFNIKIVNNQIGIRKNNNSEILIKKLIAIIWLKKLSSVNKHGLPKKTVKKQHKGYRARGRILMPKTVIPYYTEGKVISQSHEKEVDYVIARIIMEAYYKLNKYYSISILNLPKNIKDIIHEIQSMNLSKKKVTQQEYNSIKYKKIYLPYKDIIDFSWLIIKSKDILYNNQQVKNGIGFFLDMAEIWEIYIKTILKKRFKNEGWKISSDEIEVYKDTFFKRKMIPDIIMKKEERVIVLDAKYKSMKFMKDDVDRSDFFQIHTYMSYYLRQNNLLCGGLIYPFIGEIKNNLSTSLFELSGNETAFFIDGINIEDHNKFEQAKSEFIKRISMQMKE
ncbi:McrC family protein [Clostridium sardiniense]|uniref:McrC family protein n=1 Tax=Clostridium sardiniense TaxID=29369 RepID=A0ABS7KYG7_CLOSR|nr:McrC family protein [Clostridium sardiniense]MBY0755864.1 McrC family protein [Clostridium sardiniense]MDQ0459907.1 5-methylcytosine-specific restriction endonuclease McrBC regulatory subunit McrC [Clostridium sardiniense]